jgi:uncharacterized membrane protein (UPF0127 family)
MYGMRYPLDVVFLDQSGEVLAIYPSLTPGSRSGWHRNAAHALELPAGALQESDTVVGDILLWSLTTLAPAGYTRTETVS